MPETKNDRSRQNQGQQDKGDRNKMGQRQGEGKNLDEVLDDLDQDQDIDEGELPDEDKVTQRRPAMPSDTDEDRR